MYLEHILKRIRQLNEELARLETRAPADRYQTVYLNRVRSELAYLQTLSPGKAE